MRKSESARGVRKSSYLPSSVFTRSSLHISDRTRSTLQRAAFASQKTWTAIKSTGTEVRRSLLVVGLVKRNLLLVFAAVEQRFSFSCNSIVGWQVLAVRLAYCEMSIRARHVSSTSSTNMGMYMQGALQKSCWALMDSHKL
jgi:hypothetical protein